MINFSVVHNSLFILLSIIFILSTINPLKHRYEPIIDIEPQIIKIKDGKYVKIDYIIYSQIIDSKLYRKKKNENIMKLMRMKSLYILERIIRNMPYKTIVDQREYIENNLQTQLNDSLRKYGIGVERVALKNILEDSVLVSCVDKSSNETHKCTSEEVGDIPSYVDDHVRTDYISIFQYNDQIIKSRNKDIYDQVEVGKKYNARIKTEDFDTIRCVTMLPVFWKLTNYFATSFIQKIHIIPLPGQEREFSHKRLEVFATRCASYLGIWALLEVMFFKSYKHQIVELIMLFVFGGLVWIVSKYSLSAIMGSANTGKSNLVNRFNKLNLRDIYMIYKDHNEYSMYTYDPKDKDDKFIGFQIAYFRFEFLNLTKTQRNIIQEVLDRAYSDHSFELVEIIMALRSIHIAYYLTFAPTSDMSGEVAVYTYASSFLPFYKRCIEAKLYKPIR